MLIGQQLGPFAIEKELGSGAMGAVYLGRYVKTGQRVAVKVMAPGLGSNERAVARFEREAAILKQLKHPNIVRHFGTGRSHKTIYYAMEYIEGESMDHVMERRGRYTWEEVVVLGQQLCAALQHAHEQGIVHRDLKPSNLMMLPDGTLKLTDFGIAKDLDVTQLTSANCTVGTASYMSPEQCRGERDLTYKSDLYSLGVVLYELLTGRKPFLADNAMDMFLQHCQGTFERPSRIVLDIPVWLDTLVCQMLEKKPEQRPRDAATIGQALNRVLEKVTAQQSAGVDVARQRVLDRTPGSAKPDDTDKEMARTLLQGTRKGKKKRRKPFYQQAWFQGVGIVAVLAALALILYWVFKPASPEKLSADAKTLMESADTDDWEKAREGPIKEYFDHYRKRDDEQAKQMAKWADQVDLFTRERQLTKRFQKNLTPEGEAQSAAFAALRMEDAGDLTASAEKWQTLVKDKDRSSESRIWALLADKKLQELARVAERDKQLHERLEQARQSGQDLKAESEQEREAAVAIRAEQFGDLFLAEPRWEALKKQEENTRKTWFLLAAGKSRTLKEAKPKLPEGKGQKDFRQELVDKKLKDAEELSATKPLEARAICQDILFLYARNADLKTQVERAGEMLKQLPAAPAPKPRS